MRFFDTNVLVYAVDTAESHRREIAVQLLDEALSSRSLAISTQVMLEFYAAAVLKRRLVKPERAVTLLRSWAPDTMVSTTPQLLWNAFELQRTLGFSIWDAMIVQSAIESNCDTLYTEDLHDGQLIGEMRIVNPFRQGVHEPSPVYSAGAAAAPASRRKRRKA
jgi:predicted nucleic acid-binding protein